MSKPLSKAARYIIAGYAVCAATVAFAIEPALTVALEDEAAGLRGGHDRAPPFAPLPASQRRARPKPPASQTTRSSTTVKAGSIANATVAAQTA